MTHISPVKQRIQITFGKFDALKYTGNLDIAKTWERVLRRANLPLLYTQGFNARPRIQLASALPLGITSECEILDVSLKAPITLEGWGEKLAAVSPTGLRIFAMREVPIDSPTLPNLVRSAEYRIHFVDGIDRPMLQQRIDDLLNAEEIPQVKVKKGKSTTTNLRPLIIDLNVDTAGDLIAHLTVGDFGNVRPDDVLNRLGLMDEYYTVHRFQLHFADFLPGL